MNICVVNFMLFLWKTYFDAHNYCFEFILASTLCLLSRVVASNSRCLAVVLLGNSHCRLSFGSWFNGIESSSRRSISIALNTTLSPPA